MPRMTGNRDFAEAVHAYGTTHVYLVPMAGAMTAMTRHTAGGKDPGRHRE